MPYNMALYWRSDRRCLFLECQGLLIHCLSQAIASVDTVGLWMVCMRLRCRWLDSLEAVYITHILADDTSGRGTACGTIRCIMRPVGWICKFRCTYMSLLHIACCIRALSASNNMSMLLMCYITIMFYPCSRKISSLSRVSWNWRSLRSPGSVAYFCAGTIHAKEKNITKISRRSGIVLAALKVEQLFPYLLSPGCESQFTLYVIINRPKL